MQVIPVPTDYAAPSICTHWHRYDGGTVYVVGFGTSLAGFDWTRLAGRTTIALNHAVTMFAPTYHLYSDSSIRPRYWKHPYTDGTTIVVQEDVATEARAIKWVHYSKIATFFRVVDNCKDIPKNNDQLYVERTVATAGIMLAWKLGAARIFLLGVDGYRLAAKTTQGVESKNTRLQTGDYVCYADGSAHRTQGPMDTDQTIGDIVVRESHMEWAADMGKLKLYFQTRQAATAPEVRTANPRSTITAWPKCTIEEALA